MITIRFADVQDWEFILAACSSLLKSSVYSAFKFSPERLKKTFNEIRRTSKEEAVILLAEKDGEAVGVIVGLVSEPFFSIDKIANEILFYSTDKRASVLLLKAYEFWTKKVGCNIVGLSNFNSLSSLERRGYVKVEQSYFKVLGV